MSDEGKLPEVRRSDRKTKGKPPLRYGFEYLHDTNPNPGPSSDTDSQGTYGGGQGSRVLASSLTNKKPSIVSRKSCTIGDVDTKSRNCSNKLTKSKGASRCSSSKIKCLELELIAQQEMLAEELKVAQAKTQADLIKAAEVKAKAELEAAAVEAKVRQEIIMKKLELDKAKIQESSCGSISSEKSKFSFAKSRATIDPIDKVKSWLSRENQVLNETKLIGEVDNSNKDDIDYVKKEILLNKNDNENQNKPKEIINFNQVNYNATAEEKNRDMYDSQIPENNMMQFAKMLVDGMKSITCNLKRKNLIHFDGRTEDWFSFISSYRRTAHNFNPEDNLIRLQKALKGEALDTVRALFVSPNNLTTILSTLEMRFGRPEFILRSMINQVQSLSSIKDNDTSSLIKFYTAVQTLSSTAVSLEREEYLTNPQLLSELCGKLNPIFKYSWARYVHEQSLTVPTLKHFSSWLENEVKAMSIYYHPKEDDVNKINPNPSKTPITWSNTKPYNSYQKFMPKQNNNRPVLSSRTWDIQSSLVTKCPICNFDSHDRMENCPKLQDATLDERWKIITGLKVCFSCFGRHQLQQCGTKKACGINGCKLPHHKLLHKQNQPLDQQRQYRMTETVSTTQGGLTDTRVLLRMCPVVLRGPKGSIETHALLDDGSTVTLIDKDVAKLLGLEGDVSPLNISWTNSVEYQDMQSQKVTLKIRGLYEEEEHDIKGVSTMTGLELPRQNMPLTKLKRTWTHLTDFKYPLPKDDVKPTILLGQDNCHLIIPRKIREGPANAPVLSWTKLGWVVHGNADLPKGRVDKEFTLTCFRKRNVEEDLLNELVQKYFDTENFGSKPPEFDLSDKFTTDEKRALHILDHTTNFLGNRYECGLLWKRDGPKYPSSYDYAFSRLRGIEKKMDKDPEFAKEYAQKITEFVEKGYARELSPDETRNTTEKTFYLSHFGVKNPNKPGKLRFVFDAAAKVGGISFNDELLSGPDLLNCLPSVLIKFRQHKIAIVGDIKEMFPQVRIRPEDSDAQRFLWRGMERENRPDVYKMNAMIFGATCSPVTALYVVNKNARRFAEQYPDAVKTILEKEYMDDLLDSLDSATAAIARIRQVSEIHKSGGFEICNWISNSKEVLLEIPEEFRAKTSKDIEPHTSLPVERVLGVWWDADADKFTFKTHRNLEKIIANANMKFPTKREVLSATMSIYDPLGFATPTTIKGRLLVQSIWRQQTGWDEVISHELQIRYLKWIGELEQLKDLEIPRCYDQRLSRAERVDLHVFVDGSEEAYAAAGYLRVKQEGEVKTALVMARARTASIKSIITVPRMELEAAVLGCRLAQSIIDALEVKVTQRKFWSDSKTVLHWINDGAGRYKQFVAHRVAEIRRLSDAKEWHWVPTKQNVADLATRSSKKFGKSSFEFWLCGPHFIQQEEKDWPGFPDLLEDADDQEKKRPFVGVVFNEAIDTILPLEKFSSWLRLLRCVAWMLRFRANIKDSHRKGAEHKRTLVTDPNIVPELRPDELATAEVLIIKSSQAQAFREEMKAIVSGKPVSKSSNLYQLCPYLDINGILRVTGRTRESPDLEDDQKNPIILDGKDWISKLIARHFHAKFFHQGVQTAMIAIRQKYWMFGLRDTVKKVIRDCADCQRRFTKPKPPQMAPLPSCRVTKPPHAFYYTGVDYFGPMEVTVGRRHEKRWGVIFTCLSTRAVHLEVAHSLDTESCIMAIQRFVSRRPCPAEFFSDNGTNFVGTDREFRTALRELNQCQIQKVLHGVGNGIKWTFQPPKAPHMGGCWERLIRSIKTAMGAVLKSQYPKDEELRTVLARVEFAINSRPLTDIPVDPADPKPLTPNDFLLAPFSEKLNHLEFSKQKLQKIQNLTQSIWQRWIREYLPCLTKRSKWFAPQSPPQVGALAICVEEIAPSAWPLGRIKAVYPGRDGQVRVVDIETSRGTYTRPLTKVALLSEGAGC